MMKLLCFAMFACAFNLLLGFSRDAVLRSRGVLWCGGLRHLLAGDRARLGHGGGEYWPVSRSRCCSGLVIGAIAIRRRGIYFAMITLALAQLVYFVCLEAPFTGGENGLQGVPRGSLLGC